MDTTNEHTDILSKFGIGMGPVVELLEAWLRLHSYRSIAILVDENTREHCLPLLTAVTELSDARIIEIASGEQNKTLSTCTLVWNALKDRGANRQALLVNLGGGVICDLGGFAASVYKRGIDFVHIPTTLLAQVDAAIGGKTGIDFQFVKNMIGTFAKPRAVFIDPVFLSTLTERHVNNGIAEMVKHQLIAPNTSVDDLIKRMKGSAGDWADPIRESILIKANIVDQDPFEQDRRKCLNFGHTIGHGIEALSLERQGSVFHGEAVVAGMISELYLSHKFFDFPMKEILGLMRKIQPHFKKISIARRDYVGIMDFIRNDKKGDSRFVLLKAPGHPVIDVNCPESEIIASLNFYSEAYGV